jgi:hypothetical protein
MSAITRGRIIATAGILTLSGLLGAAVAVPGPWHDVKTAMSHDGTPGPWHDARLAMSHDGTPGPWHEIVLASAQTMVPGTMVPDTVAPE